MRGFVVGCLSLLGVVACAQGPLERGEAPEESVFGAAQGGVIYGSDGRKDRYEVDGVLGALADATIAVMDRTSVRYDGSGYEIDVSRSFAESYAPMCSGEPFREQPTTAWCSAFPVGPDLVATAGHCVDDKTCAPGGGRVAFVFGYHMLNRDTPRTRVGADDVYFCKEVVHRVETSTNDWALVRMTRPIVGRQPMAFRRTEGQGKVPTGTSVLVSGHPMGLPVKLAGGAKVKNNTSPTFFDANLDTYGGNSGSPVVNADRLAAGEILVEGILVRGSTDMVESGGCYASNKCSDGQGCEGGGTFEGVTRTSLLASYVASCGNGVIDAGEECDGSQLGGAVCSDYGCGGGVVTCNDDCTLEHNACTACVVCGDGVCAGGETSASCPSDCASDDSGPVGDSGPDGDSGTVGDSGPDGDSGPVGDSGSDGDSSTVDTKTVTLLSEGFEEVGDGSYTTSSAFHDGSNDHFSRTDGSDISNTTAPYSGFDGTFVAGEDLDDDGGDGLETKTLSFQVPTPLTGFSALTVSLRVAAGNDGASSGGYDFTSKGDPADYLRVQYSTDKGGTWQDVLSFVPACADATFNHPLGHDENGDGCADTLLTPEARTFAAKISTDGGPALFRIVVSADAATEEIAFDDLVVTGQPL